MTRSTVITTLRAIADTAIDAIDVVRRRYDSALRDPQRHMFVPSDSYFAADVCRLCGHRDTRHRPAVVLLLVWARAAWRLASR